MLIPFGENQESEDKELIFVFLLFCIFEGSQESKDGELTKVASPLLKLESGITFNLKPTPT